MLKDSVASSIESFIGDVRYALRLLAKSRTFTAVAIGSLAFGIGVNTTLFSIVHSVLLQELPYERAQDLYSVREVFARGPNRFNSYVNSGNFLLWSQHAKSFSGMAALRPTNDNLILKDRTLQIHGVQASASLFAVMGVHPRLGHVFTEEQDRMGSGLSIVLTDTLWKRQFHADPAIVGSKLNLNGYPAVVSGVLSPSFYFPKQTELYPERVDGWTHPIEYFTNLSLMPDEVKPGMQSFNFAVIARMKPGVGVSQAVTELNALEWQVAKDTSSDVRLWAEMKPLKTTIIGPSGRSLWICLSGALVVLLLVCLNLCGLLLAKSVGRVKEIEVRQALGASRLQLLRQFAVEGFVLAMAGGLAGLCVAYWGVRTIALSEIAEIPRLESVTIDENVLFVCCLVTLGTCMLFSLAPALRLTGRGPSGMSRPVSRVHQTLAIAQVALCTVLLISALLISRSFLRVWQTNRQMAETRVVTMELAMSADRYNDARERQKFYDRVIAEARAYPGVEAAGIVSALPLTGDSWNATFRFLEQPSASPHQMWANYRFMSPDYPRAVGLPLIAGRAMSDSDLGRHCVLISEDMAKQIRQLNPIGLHVLWRSPADTVDRVSEVIGVVKDVRIRPDKAPPHTILIPYWEWPPWNPSLVVRTSGDTLAATAGLAKVIRRIDPEVAPSRPQTMRALLSAAVAARRIVALLGLTFAGSATLLAGLGLYGLVSLSALQRTREMAIRMALGARPGTIVHMVASQSLRLAIIGLAFGFLGAWGASRLLIALLYGIKPEDPATFITAGVLVLTISLLAALIPARRAMQIDPVAAMKWD